MPPRRKGHQPAHSLASTSIILRLMPAPHGSFQYLIHLFQWPYSYTPLFGSLSVDLHRVIYLELLQLGCFEAVLDVGFSHVYLELFWRSLLTLPLLHPVKKCVVRFSLSINFVLRPRGGYLINPASSVRLRCYSRGTHCSSSFLILSCSRSSAVSLCRRHTYIVTQWRYVSNDGSIMGWVWEHFLLGCDIGGKSACSTP